MAQTFTQSTDGLQTINTVLAEEANRIGSDVHKNTLHTSPWIDLIKKETFPDQMGYNLTTLVYSNALPTTADNGTTLSTGGDLWKDAGADSSGNTFGTNTRSTSGTGQNLNDAAASIEGVSTGKGFVQFGKELKQYNLVRAVVESPKIDVQDLRFAAHRTEQLRAIMDVLTESTRYVWEERYRDEFDKLCDNYVACREGVGDASTLTTGREGLTSLALMDDSEAIDTTTDGTYLDGGQADTDLPEANISNAVMDDIYFKLVRAGAGTKAYGRENGRPVFGLVCSSEVSRQLQIEDSIRDDVRYNKARVSDLIAPLGVEKSFRGFYHLVDDLAPRFDLKSRLDGGADTGSATGDDTLERVYPYSVSGGIVTPNALYDRAPIELAYVIHEDVFTSQIPSPLTGGSGLSFDPVSYKGDFKWTNIPDAIINPDGTIGFFRGVMASASKPIKPKFGYAIAIQRNSTKTANGL